MTAFIETFTGRTFKPLEPDWADIQIKDIAHALASQGRFTGHSRFRYSVAEHSVRVAEYLAWEGYKEPIQLWGLLHDASEAYLVDLPTPLKLSESIGVPYRAAEARLMSALCHRFALPVKEPQSVRDADAALLATEVRDLMHGDRPYWAKIKAKPLPGRIRPWGADVAEYEFLRLYERLAGVS